MKRITFSAVLTLLVLAGYAQTDTTINNEPDTIRVGNFIIVKKKGKDRNDTDTTPQKKYSLDITIGKDDGNYSEGRSRHYRSNVSTNWFIIDLGFANWRDKTDYGSAAVMNSPYLKPTNGGPFTAKDFDLNNAKSSNVNIWLFMQKLNITKHVLNLKYGIGIEMYNYKYSSNITYHRNDAYIFRDTIGFSKNKLSADYVTVPFMLNIDPFPHRRRGLSFSAGVTAGYLYSSRNKQESDERGKQKIKGDFDLNPWRLAYVAEAGLGPIRLYGSYSINTLHEHGLSQYPYVVGLRLSNW